MAKPIRVIQYGLGAIGRSTARLALARPNIELVGAIDSNPALAGQDLGSVLGLAKRLGISVASNAAEVFATTNAQAVTHCTTSFFDKAYDQFEEIARAGLHCVTSCEEALFPAYRHRALAEQLNALCIEHQVAMVGSGVNPGFVMDTLPALLTAVCQRVDQIHVCRVVNAGTRRAALQQKVGAGLTEQEFTQRVKAGQMGHIGLAESLAFLADALGWELTRIKDSIEPVLARKRHQTEVLTVKKGAVAGIRQITSGFIGRSEVLTLELQMFVGAAKPRDEIKIEGEPPLTISIGSGVPGDIATPAILVNLLPRIVAAMPGWHSMATLALPRLADSFGTIA